jgi:hypothetical protein
MGPAIQSFVAYATKDCTDPEDDDEHEDDLLNSIRAAEGLRQEPNSLHSRLVFHKA